MARILSRTLHYLFSSSRETHPFDSDTLNSLAQTLTTLQAHAKDYITHSAQPSSRFTEIANNFYPELRKALEPLGDALTLFHKVQGAITDLELQKLFYAKLEQLIIQLHSAVKMQLHITDNTPHTDPEERLLAQQTKSIGESLKELERAFA